ncbi:MAG: phosphoribosylanthranilate isomerase, partial [Gemmatimonadaceae bacterium]
PWRVGVFAGATADEVARTAEQLALDVVQLHGVGETTLLSALRGRTDAEIWSVLHVGPEGVEEASLHAALLGDGVLLDTRSDEALGGTGRTFNWESTAASLEPYRSTRRFVLAGGLTPGNVGRAIAALAPDVVDVSSGVERGPGHKDHARMRAFADAVHGVLPR